MSAWLNQHLQALQLVLGRMRRNLPATLIMCAVMGVTLCLPATLHVIIANLDRLAGDLQGSPQISLFLRLDSNRDTLEALSDRLRTHPAIASVRFVSRDEAWQQLRQKDDPSGVLASLERNPLPDAYFVTPRAMTPDALEALQRELGQWDGVETAQLDTDWIKRLHALLQLGKKGVLVLVLLLGFALVAIIGNTIRLQILTQREEIEVSKLIGATDRFIRRPFLYAGTLYGLGSGLLAWLLLAAVVALFNRSLAEISALYGSDFLLQLPLSTTGLIIASAVVLSWLGSYLAVGRALSRLDAA